MAENQDVTKTIHRKTPSRYRAISAFTDIHALADRVYLRAPEYFIGTQAPSCLLLATHC
jgi:hypothetical protein